MTGVLALGVAPALDYVPALDFVPALGGADCDQLERVRRILRTLFFKIACNATTTTRPL